MAACSSSSIINRNLAAWHGAEDCVSDDKAPLTQSSTSGCVVRFARCRSEGRVAVFVGEIFEPNHLLLTNVVLERLLRLLPAPHHCTQHLKAVPPDVVED